MPSGCSLARRWAPAMIRAARQTIDIPAVMHRVSEAAVPFETRWTMRALQRVDPELHDRFADQQGLYHDALITGDAVEVEEQSAAMCRGWVAVTRAMEAAAVPDDAYVLGFHSATGTRVAIGDQKQAIARVRQMHGDQVVWITPDEVAALIAGLETLKAAKALWPDAEVIQLYPKEPAQGDR